MATDESPPKHRSAYSPHRHSHRSRADAQAHADDALHPHEQPISHPLVCQAAPELIITDDGVRALAVELRQTGSFAFDSEFIGELSYLPRLCLIQIASPSRVALIDPFAEVDLNPLWDLLRDPAVEKIVHAGQQDVEPLFRDGGIPPANLFDTQIAAGFAGYPYPLSLAKLVQTTVGARLKKGLTFTDWGRRPLSSQQLRYAADDVRYLPAVRKTLVDRLIHLGQLPHAIEESAALTNPQLYQFDPEANFMRLRGAGSLPPQGLAILKELTQWRQAEARRADVPPRSFLKDEILIDLARNPIKNLQQLSRVRGLPRPAEAEFGQNILDMTTAALALPADAQPAVFTREPPPEEKFQADALWAAAQCLCSGQGVDPNLATSRQEIGEVYRALLGSYPTTEFRVMKGWRRELLGQHLADLLAGKSQFSVRWPADGVRTTITPTA